MGPRDFLWNIMTTSKPRTLPSSRLFGGYTTQLTSLWTTALISIKISWPLYHSRTMSITQKITLG